MPQGNPEQIPANQPFEACISNLEYYLMMNGRPADFDRQSNAFRQPQTAECDAYTRIITVADRDSSITEFDEPIMYDAALFTDKGTKKSGMVATLAQELPALNKRVVYEFTDQKTVRRRSMINGEESVESALATEEVAALADQLATIDSASAN